MKTSIGKVVGMLAVGIFLSAGRAWAVMDPDMGLTSQEKKAMAAAEAASAAKVNALAELLAKQGITESCAARNVQVMLEIGRGDVVKCWNDAQDAYKIILDSNQMAGSPFFIARIWGTRGILPQKYILMYKGAKTLQENDAAVSPAEVSAALERARLKSKQKAIEDITKKIEASGVPFDSKK